jgi:alkylated DNA repair dioxygenase AlkB
MSELVYGDTVNLLPHPAEVLFYPDFFSKEEADIYLKHLTELDSWQQEPIKLFGKTVMQPRLTAFYGDDDVQYTYSGLTVKGSRWTEMLNEIRVRIEKKFGIVFNAALLNFYRDGADHMGWHRDNEKALGKYPVIASLSFGQPRIFQFRSYADKIPIVSIELTHGSVLLMRGETQDLWEHRLPKNKMARHPRINLTFRLVH